MVLLPQHPNRANHLLRFQGLLGNRKAGRSREGMIIAVKTGLVLVMVVSRYALSAKDILLFSNSPLSLEPLSTDHLPHLS